MLDPYYYKLKYTHGNIKTTVTFPAEINIKGMRDRLVEFLLAVGWSQVSIDSVFNGSEE